ncbi:DNA polymerase III subunit gamma/tau [Helcococcus kunzii]|uniref:DNA polymerase III subunit gamma/tau n=1 Tax=Helcococcus kunzii TaxID=40091 RepID=UPI0038AC58D3
MRQALYRKYRPQTFSEVFGQDNIVNILKNQIKHNQISHAYIFSGTRGTGKTSTAKIFAKAINCLNPIDGNPCNECANCRSIISEENMDIIEMDAASNRGIDDIRQLRDQVIYPPSTLKYKVYIIDEAHMITREAFNALLKIMEEPPKHLVFILATTELEKIPDTILSRTQRFEFKSLSEEDIQNQIRFILDKENISMEDRAIEIIASVASGAMRDALSILDQVISIGKESITTSEVTDLLGIFSDEVKINYARAVFNKDIKLLIETIDNELDKGKDPHNFIKDIITFFKDLIYIKVGIKKDIFNGISDEISLDQLINTVDLLLEYEELMKKSDSAAILFRLSSIKIIDYMPRKQLEAKIINLEERLQFLEKNGVKNLGVRQKERSSIPTKKKIDINVEKSDNFLDNEEVVEKESEESLEAEQHEMGDNHLEENSLEEDNHAENEETNHVDMLMSILDERYPATNIMFEGLVDTRLKGNNIIFTLDEEHMPMSVSMNYFVNKALKDLEEKTDKAYSVKFVPSTNQEEVEEENEDTIEKLKELFPDGKLNIREKK